MSEILETLYRLAPIPLQNLMVTIYGYQLHHIRYGGHFQHHLTEVRDSQYWVTEDLVRWQQQRLTLLVRHAYEHTRYYRQLFDHLGIRPDSIRTVLDLRRLPILSTDEVRSHFLDFRAVNIPSRNIFLDHTSGTTGSPLTVYIDKNAVQCSFALLALVREWAGIKPGSRIASFPGRLTVPVSQKSPPFWRYNISENRILFSSYHLSLQNTPTYVRKLQEFRPALIEGYASSIYLLARYMQELNLNGVYPQTIIPNAETVLEYQRAFIEKQFRCKVHDYYGTAETLVFAGQCLQGRYHLCPGFGIVEVVREDGSPAAVGEAGALVLTGLMNYGMPLIRYKVGDMGALSDERCPCGRTWPVLASVTGRIEDVITTPDGRTIGRLDPVFKGIEHVIEAQIVQKDLSQLQVLVVRGKGFGDNDAGQIIKSLRQRVGHEIGVQIEFVDNIPRTRTGKFRFVVSHIAARQLDIQRPTK